MLEKNAGFSQRIKITGASSGSGVYAGDVGNTFEVNGDQWNVQLEWNNNSGSNWQPSAMSVSTGSISPLVLVRFLGADDNFPAQRDGDYDDLVVQAIDMGPAFEITQRPYAVDRGTLMMMPDGIFDASQGLQYMGVKIRNDWEYDWDDWTGMMIGIAPESKAELSSMGIQVIDTWSSTEQIAIQQEMENGFVKVPRLAVGRETTVFFKINVLQAQPSKPKIAFVAQRSAWDNAYNAPSRQVKRTIFISKSTYNPDTKELIAEVPEGTVYMKLGRTLVDKFAAEDAVAYARKHPCKRKPPSPGSGGSNGSSGVNRDQLGNDLRRLLEALLDGKKVDPCKIAALLDECCGCGGGKDGGGRGDGGNGRPWEGPWNAGGKGGLGEGSGGDDWCRFRPFLWLPVEFEYRVVPNPAYSGQFGPLAFEDPWWKVLLILLAIILAIASILTDMFTAGTDPNFIIGRLVAISDRAVDNIDAALSSLNGSRGVDLDVLDAQSDDANNGLPVVALDAEVSMDRSNNGDSGIEDAVVGDVVFKSGSRSGTTRGSVVSTTANLNLQLDDGGSILFTNQLSINPLAAPNNQPVSQKGDSGSVWVKLSTLRPVGLNFSGDLADAGTSSGANPIRSVVNLFNIHFNV